MPNDISNVSSLIILDKRQFGKCTIGEKDKYKNNAVTSD